MNTKQFFIQIIILFFMVVQPCYAYRTIELSGVERRDVIREDTLREQAKFGNYEIKIYRDWDIGTFGTVQIFKEGQIVFEEQQHKFSLGASDGDMRLDHSPEIGQDITGDGEPNLVISEWSGGMHCCFSVYIFSIGKEFRLIDIINGEHGFIGFDDLDGDGVLEFISFDWTFAYWHECFAGSPAPKVILAYRDGRYQLAYDLMQKPAIDDSSYYEDLAEYVKVAPNVCKDDSGVAPWKNNGQCIISSAWGHMLTLIYTGHPDEAWAFLDRIWEGDEVSKQAFLDDFKGQLALSDYADDLPVDLSRYTPDIDDEAQRKDLRFQTYYNSMIQSLESFEKKNSQMPNMPGIDSIENQQKIDGALRGWSGQK